MLQDKYFTTFQNCSALNFFGTSSWTDYVIFVRHKFKFDIVDMAVTGTLGLQGSDSKEGCLVGCYAL